MHTAALSQSSVARTPVSPAADFMVGEWLVEPDLSRVSRNGVAAHVRPKLMDLLVYLARNSGRTVPHEELLASVWPGQPFIASTALPRCIAELRQALGDRAAGSTMIQTIPKRGYRLIATVGLPAQSDRWLEEPRPTGAPPVPRPIIVLPATPASPANGGEITSSASTAPPGEAGRSPRHMEAREDPRADRAVLRAWLLGVRRLVARLWQPFHPRRQ